MSVRLFSRLLAVVVLALTALAAALLLRPGETSPPAIQGAVLPTPKPLANVNLVDHRGEPVSTADLTGRWHLVSYGFTHCPDICPTMLADLAKFQHLLTEKKQFRDLQVLFYSIDPQRDTASQLANYVPWFHKDFLGLRADDPSQAQAFERSLGMQAFVVPAERQEDYQVSHGFRLYLLDDKAQLRASLAPTVHRDGSRYYEPKQLLDDYIAIRRWIAG